LNGASFVESFVHHTNSNRSCQYSLLHQNSNSIHLCGCSKKKLHYEFEVNKAFTCAAVIIIVSFNVLYMFLMVVILSLNSQEVCINIEHFAAVLDDRNSVGFVLNDIEDLKSAAIQMVLFTGTSRPFPK